MSSCSLPCMYVLIFIKTLPGWHYYPHVINVGQVIWVKPPCFLAGLQPNLPASFPRPTVSLRGPQMRTQAGLVLSPGADIVTAATNRDSGEKLVSQDEEYVQPG